MNLCDSNIWLALAIDQHRHHQAARRWFETIEGPASVLFCRATQQALLSLLTTASIFAPFGSAPLGNRQAWEIYDAFLADDRIAYQSREPAGLEPRWRQFAARDAASPKLWMDAYLAAFASAGGFRMVTTDAAFAQFHALDLLLISTS